MIETATRSGSGLGEFQELGFLIIPEYLNQDTLERARAETLAICRGERGAIRGVTPATADDDDDAVLRRYLCIHFPHKVSSLMREVALRPGAVDVLTTIIGPNVKMMQSMLFIKSEGKPGQAWHQDENFIPTRDRSLTAIWIALDNATVENGCLWVIPGSHRRGVLYPDREQQDPRYDCTREAFGFDEDAAIPVEVPARSAVVFNGYLLHRSLPNSGRHGLRRALVNHYMSAESLLPWRWPDSQTAMGKLDHRDILMVAGKDPYAYKGTVDLMTPHIRSDREGGCVT
jgi:ectoine hydroxylase-related dioxygenase (phytanoyl-CoA dioxygenase family)